MGYGLLFSWLIACCSASSPPQAGWSQRHALSDWSRVVNLYRGTEIKLIVGTLREGRRYLIHADDSGITVLNLEHRSLPRSVRKKLRDAARHNPGALLAANHSVREIDSGVRIGPAGLFHKNRKLKDLAEVIASHQRVDVLQISRPERRGSRAGAFAGGLAGFLVGVRAAVSVGFKHCGRSCNDEGALMLLSLIGLPVAAAVGGYHAAAHRVDVIHYRAWRP
jgi:hypothetical protein